VFRFDLTHGVDNFEEDHPPPDRTSTAAAASLSLPPRATTMLSRQLLRPLSGTRRLAQTHGARAFSATTKKRAEVELTIGEYLAVKSAES